MKIHRFWVEEVPSKTDAILTSPELIHQIKDVLQLRPGEIIQLFSSTQERQAELVTVSKQAVQIRLAQEIPDLIHPKIKLHLAVSLLKGNSWDELVRECIPLGIQDIQPLVCERSIVRELTPAKLRRYQLIAKEAVEQSGWRTIPRILPVITFTAWISNQPAQRILFLHHPGKSLKQIDLLQDMTVVVGPEGGWTDQELSVAQNLGIQPTSLTPATLTARLTPVVACASMLALASHN